MSTTVSEAKRAIMLQLTDKQAGDVVHALHIAAVLLGREDQKLMDAAMYVALRIKNQVEDTAEA